MEPFGNGVKKRSLFQKNITSVSKASTIKPSTMAPNPTLPAKRTVGEELFLVHLSRQDPEDLILDKDGVPIPPRQRSKSIGEELFDIHLKRCAGGEPDYDVPKKPKSKRTAKKKQASPSAHVINLRNRDVPPPTPLH
jgi:hypothetical protein